VVPPAGTALNPVDKLLAAYLGFVTLVIVVRGGAGTATVWLITAHVLFFLLLYLLTRLAPRDTIGVVLHDLYPLFLLMALYTEIGLLGYSLGTGSILERDAIVQGWEESIFGMQVSYEWIRRAPSVFWSGVLHLAYAFYIPLVLAGPIVLEARGEREKARRVLFTAVVAYVTCWIVFVLWPVAGPNYVFPHPTGPVRDVWSARLVYSMLHAGSAVGAAFPSSHVAATVAVVGALWSQWRVMGLALVLPATLLVIATVYCQMHYGIDAVAGLVVAGGAIAVGLRVRNV
jgi:membrane-associated phospholipid phosphatase